MCPHILPPSAKAAAESQIWPIFSIFTDFTSPAIAGFPRLYEKQLNNNTSAYDENRMRSHLSWCWVQRRGACWLSFETHITGFLRPVFGYTQARECRDSPYGWISIMETLAMKRTHFPKEQAITGKQGRGVVRLTQSVLQLMGIFGIQLQIAHSMKNPPKSKSTCRDSVFG